MSSTRSVRPNVVLAICCMSLLVVSLDSTIVNIALPSIRRDLGAGTAGLQWVIDGYTMVVASFLMLSGSLADRFGRRRTFQTGMTIFTLASLLCSVAPSIGWLIVGRMVQAIGGSMLNPVAMSIITNTFIEPRERARAIGVWGAVVGVSMALGPLVGGVITQSAGWRSIFWINLPIGAAAVLLTQLFVPESKAPVGKRIDPVGQALVFVGLTALVSSVIEGPRRGWSSPLILGLFAAAACAFVGLLLYEPRRREPLLDLRFFRSIPFSSATAIALTMLSGFAGFGFLNVLYLQEVRGLRPLQAGLCMLPIAVMTTACAPISARIVGRRGTQLPLVIAGSSTVICAALLTQLTEHTSLAGLVVIYAVFGTGFGFVQTPITNTAVSGMPRAQAGLAAAIASTCRLVGATLGVAIAGAVVSGQEHGAHGVAPGFTHAMLPFFWLLAGCGLLTIYLGVLSNGERARASVRRIAALLDPPEEPAPAQRSAR